MDESARATKAMERLSQMRGAIFDLDGTLLDSMWVWEDVDRRFLVKRGIEVPPDYMAAVSAMQFSEAADYTIERFKLADCPEALMSEWMEMTQEAYAHDIYLKPDAMAYLEHLRQKGVLLGVATSSSEELFVPALKNNGIYAWFDAFATTGEAGRGKEFPDVFWLAARRLNLNPADCVVFEDTPAGLKGAAAGGFITVGVYDSYSESQQDEVIAASNLYIRDFSQMWDFVDASEKYLR